MVYGKNRYCAVFNAVFGNGIFVMNGKYHTNQLENNYAILTSRDGTNWQEQHYVNEGGFYSMRYIGGKFFGLTGVGLSAPIMVSSNGYNWTFPSTPFGFGGFFCHGAAYGNGRYIAVGGDFWDSTSTRRYNVLVSTNGTAWTFSPYWWKTVDPAVERPDTVAVAFGNGFFVAFAYTNFFINAPTVSDVRCSTMTNGAAWPALDYAPGGISRPWPPFYDVAFGNGVFVLVGTNIVVITNQNLATNKVVSSAPITPPTSNVLWRVIFEAGMFIASTGTEVLTSQDGVTWTNRGPVPGFIRAFGNGRFLATPNSFTNYFYFSDSVTAAVTDRSPGSLRLTGITGRNHQIQASDTLVSSNWQTIGNITLTNSPQSFADPQATNFPQRFYRTQLLP